MTENTPSSSFARATQRPASFKKPAHWSNDPAPSPAPAEETEAMSPTRYGDWERNGIAVDF
ncbi:MAG TPA: DUF1674 domain-containing protein [Novosphingobium sp.]